MNLLEVNHYSGHFFLRPNRRGNSTQSGGDCKELPPQKCSNHSGLGIIAYTVHVWYIYLHLIDFHGKSRYRYTSPMDPMGFFGNVSISRWSFLHAL